MRTAITLCRVAESAAGPFVFHDPLEVGFAKAAKAGFDDVELFFPGPDAVEIDEVKALCDQHGLGVAAVGTGAGMVKHGLSLTNPDPSKRDAALEFIQAMIEFGGQLGAPAILGSMQGRWGGEITRDQALGWLGDALRVAGETAGGHGVPFIYEPLNRYESNLINDQKTGAEWIEAEGLSNIVMLADLFHMNIEEADIAQGIRDGGRHIGHVHFADSNRRAMGMGHIDPAPIVQALQEIGYRGAISAEVFPLPDAETAARQTMKTLRSLIPGL